MTQVIIVGGGIAGLIASILLGKKGIECTLIEKRNYPAHRVCGEYISKEAVPFLESEELLPQNIILPNISRFMLSSVSGKSASLNLDLGGIGISRFCFDQFLYRKAIQAGVNVLTDTAVEDVRFSNDSFRITTAGAEFNAPLVVGAFGKRSTLDTKLNRPFIKKRSPFVGVKYHVRLDFPDDLIALHNFNGGYCGISRVENNVVNVCYLTHRQKLKDHKTIRKMEEEVLFKNPFLREIFTLSTPLFEKPETINEINFETKRPVEDHMLMVGDAAGMITPLCGNGMAMAIHSAKLAAANILDYMKHGNRSELESCYRQQWNTTFRRRLWIGRQVQRLFGSEVASSAAINLAVHLHPFAELIIRNTHGKPF